MVKPSGYGPDYSRECEWGVILEDLQRQFRTFGEVLEDIRDRVCRLEDDVKVLKEDMRLVKAILPTFVTKEQAKAFATKKDLERFATKEDLERFATKEDLKRFATKEDLNQLKCELKEEMKLLATKKDLEVLERRLVALESAR